MISGRVIYRTGNNTYTYTVDAFDTSETFSMYITSGNYLAIRNMSGLPDDSDQDCLWERSVEVKLSKIVVQTGVTVSPEGKRVREPINTDFFCRLGALIRYAKTSCIASNEEGYTGLRLASGEFEAMKRKHYMVLFPDSGECFAKLSLEYGNIMSLSLKTNDFEIELSENFDDEERIFLSPKDKAQVGFRLNTEYLGFTIPQVDTSNNRPLDGVYRDIEDIIKAHPEKELRWLRGQNYQIVDDDNLESICKYIMSWNDFVYYDTETTGLNINFLSRVGQADQLVGVVLSVKYGESFYFPLQMKYIPNLCGGDHWYVMEHYLRPILETKNLVVHNLSFDWKVAYIYDINCNIVHDTMAILSLTFGSEIKDYSVGLKENTKILLGRDSLELSDLIVDDKWGENDIKFWDLPPEAVRLYACADTDNTNGLLQYFLQNDILGRYGATKIYEIEIAFSYAVGYQEFYGHSLDVDKLDILRKDVGVDLENYMNKMVEIVGHDFNPNSPKQLQQIMYVELGIPEQISRKTGRVTTDKDTLKHLAELTDIEDNVKYPFCKYLLEYRKAEGVRKIVDKFPETMTQDGYIFSRVMQYGTTTGRVSINKPNYQSYSDAIKKNVVPRPGYYMTDTDYSSVEYRVLANMVGNDRIMGSFEDPDFDYHTYQAAHMYGIPYSAVTKQKRKAAKSINFGLPYGMGDESLGVRVFGEASPENTRKAAALRAAYFKGQEDIRDWFEYLRDKGVNLGYTETYFGRRRYYRRTDFTVNAIRRQAGNQVIQGCCSLHTHILTKEFGIVELGDVLDQIVTVWNGREWSNGDVLFAGNKRKTVIKFKGGQVMECSPTHKFLVSTKTGGTMWVEAQHLHALDKYKNPHRIIVNQNFGITDYAYQSERKHDSANDVYLSDINDSYKTGVVLGRLASTRDQDSDAVVQTIEKHEHNILPILRECLESLGYTEDRSETATCISVHSASLSREIDDLDIRNKIHKNVFMDTELLRGFLCGYFDGAGGISSKTITCVFDKHSTLSKLVHDMQVALMFFGVRSTVKDCDGKYVLQIKTNDNNVFLREVGFLNKDKQYAGSELHSVEGEKTFGKCLIVESVEITDELIPMADVCNTDGGFYVADGLITHNTAADIYKTAVGRVFKRICKEGWLGKVLLDCFIHDELLIEVSVDINPGVWLRVLREEFEVAVFNDDGSQWCPLYMGFGYGTSWYEAKSVELPIKLQWELVKKYGESGFPDWNGDARSFCDTIPDMLRDFEIRDIRNQITDAKSQGKEIKPALNSALLDCVKADAKLYPDGISDYIQESGDFAILQSGDMNISDYLSTHEEAICEYLDKTVHIQTLYKKDGVFVDSFDPSKETQECLTQFCMLHDVDRSIVDLSNIEEYTESGGGNFADYPDDLYEDAEGVDALQRVKDTRIDTLGMFLDVNAMEVTLLMLPQQYMAFIKSLTNTTKGYSVYFKDSLGLQDPNNKGGLYKTKVYIDSKEIPTLQEMYLQYFKSQK